MKTIALVIIAFAALQARAELNANTEKTNPTAPAKPMMETSKVPNGEEMGQVEDQVAGGGFASRSCNTYAPILRILREKKLMNGHGHYAKEALELLVQFNFSRTATTPATFKDAKEGEICVTRQGVAGSIMMKRNGKWWDGCNEHPEGYIARGFAGCVAPPKSK